MEITLEQLEARRTELQDAVTQHQNNLNAAYGALQQVDLLIAQVKAPALPADTKSKK